MAKNHHLFYLMQSIFQCHDNGKCQSRPLDNQFSSIDSIIHPTILGLKKDAAVEILSGIMSSCRLYVQRKRLLAMHLCGILWTCYHQMLSPNHTKIKCKQLHNVNRLCIFTWVLMQRFVFLHII
jgi:hypothetical protein